MKKLLTALFICLIALCSFTAGKTVTVSAEKGFWENLYNDIDNSNIPHDRAKVYLQVIGTQYNKQVSDSTINK